MKKILLFTFLFCFSFSSCEDEDSPCDSETFTSKLIPGKEILVEFDTELNRNNFIVTAGNNLLFEHIHGGAQCDHISDDEWSEVLIFQIDKNLSFFRFEDEEILSTHAFYRQIGAWVVSIPYGVNSGVISGEKLNENQWRVTVDIEVVLVAMNEITQKVQFTEVYRN